MLVSRTPLLEINVNTSTMSQILHVQVAVPSPRVTLSISSHATKSIPLVSVEVAEIPTPPSSPVSPADLLIVTNIPAPHSGHIRLVQLNQPSTRNAISRALLAELRREIDAVHAQYDPITGNEILATDESGNGNGNSCGPTRALIIASAVDTCFCAGADLKERRGFTPEQ